MSVGIRTQPQLATEPTLLATLRLMGAWVLLAQELTGQWGSYKGPMPLLLPRRDPGAAVSLGMLCLLPDHLWHLHQPDPQMVAHVLRAAMLGHLSAGLARDPATETPSHPPRGAP